MRRLRLLAVLWLAACNGGDPGTRAVEGTPTIETTAEAPIRVDILRDSAGVHFSPSFTTIALTRTGGVVALDNDDNRVRVFDSTGLQQYAVGRAGQGPGEFRQLSRAFVLPADSVAVWDPTLRRMSFFDATLKLDRMESFVAWDFSGIYADVVGRFADGRWLATLTPFRGFEDGARLVMDTATLVAGRSGEIPRRLLSLPPRAVVEVWQKGYGDRIDLSELNPRVGAVCDSGVVLVDSVHVRLISMRSQDARTWPLPRGGVPIRTANERDAIIGRATAWADALPMRAQIRASVATLAKRYTSRMPQPTIDSRGALWYDRALIPSLGNGLVERVEHAGRRSALVQHSGPIWSSHVGSNAIAVIDYGSDTTSLTVRIAHYARGWDSHTSNALGRCFPAFRY